MELTLSFRDYFLRPNRNLVTVEDFTQYLGTFQKIINLIAKERGYKRNIGDFRFLIKDFNLNSFECVIESYLISKDLRGKDPVEDVIKDFTEISKLIDIDIAEENKSYQKLKETIKKNENRKTLYNYFERIIPRENLAFQIYIGRTTDPSRRIFRSKYKYRKRIGFWRIMDTEKKVKSFIGIVKSLNAYNPEKKYIKFVDNMGNKIQYYYKSDEEKRFTKLYDSNIIKISGKYDPYQKIILDLTEFKIIEDVEMTELRKLVFKYPVRFKLEYKYGTIYASNEEFGLFAMGSTYNKMLKDLHNRIVTTLEIYSNPSIKFTKASEKYRIKFLDVFS